MDGLLSSSEATARCGGPALQLVVPGDEDPQRDIDELAHAEQAEEHKPEPDKSPGDFETVGQGSAHACEDFAASGSNQDC